METLNELGKQLWAVFEQFNTSCESWIDDNASGLGFLLFLFCAVGTAAAVIISIYEHKKERNE